MTTTLADIVLTEPDHRRLSGLLRTLPPNHPVGPLLERELDRAEVVEEIASTGDPRAAALLEALGEGDLHARKADGAVIRVTGRGSRAQGIDALSGVELGPVPPRSTEAI